MRLLTTPAQGPLLWTLTLLQSSQRPQSPGSHELFPQPGPWAGKPGLPGSRPSYAAFWLWDLHLWPVCSSLSTCLTGRLLGCGGKAGKPESSVWHRVALECYLLQARKPSLTSPPKDLSSCFSLGLNVCPDVYGIIGVPCTQHCPGFTLNACRVDKRWTVLAHKVSHSLPLH